MTQGSTWSARPTGPRTGRLSAEDWARAGLDLLMTEGRSAVKISRLCADFGVTKGSFYWHFADFDALMAAIARLYFSQEMDAARGLVTMEEMPPDARLETMSAMLVESRAWEGEAAIREWARADETVAEVVAELDQRILRVVHGAFVELGFSERGARIRAGVLVYAGIGFVYGRSALPVPTVEEIHDVLALLVKPET
ncbi:TetR/AcrR family transcriptional regulator [Dietzia maris]|uniref:TetR/AcrR family transcriptional regulator n=1 Tax=Dietzia maris TaxID=37915 RepID=UPI00223BD068|nr:TetR/AcrR family transcriptional regulator [Dietzia maris]MCT1435219.1 TetR/AcrR family transcriptional regulator [Dietzia maris]MCT1521753.1 TetR/AcrR family transcriptional regulator [Dietzia maris]